MTPQAGRHSDRLGPTRLMMWTLALSGTLMLMVPLDYGPGSLEPIEREAP